MSILLISSFFPPYLMGGTEQSAEQLALRLAQAGEEVGLFTFDYGQGTYQSRLPNLQVFTQPVPAAFQQSERVRFRAAPTPLFLGYYGRALRQAIDAFSPAVVHAQDKFALVAAGLAKTSRAFPLVFTLRDYGLLCTSAHCLMQGVRPSAPCGVLRQLACAKNFLQSRNLAQTFGPFAKYALSDFPFRLAGLYQARLALASVDRLIFISYAVREIYASAHVLPAGLAGEVIYNFPPEPLKLSPVAKRALRHKLGVTKGKLFVFVGKLSPGKGADVLMRALAQVLPKVGDLHFACAGALTEAIRPLVPPNERLLLLGRLPYKEALALMAAADAVVYPSVWPEPHGRVPMEALAHHTPLIATRSGGIPETVTEGQNSLLVPPGEVKALAEALRQLASDARLLRKLKRGAAKGNLDRFDPQRLLAGYCALYREASKVYEND